MLLTSILLLTGLILLVYASDRIVYGAAVFSRSLGISPFITGILVAGPGTSLPELLTSGVEVAIITGRKAKLLEDRANTLGITHLYQGQSDKLLAYRELLDKLAVRPGEVAYIGDDLIDWPVMAEVGLSAAVADAHPLLLPKADYVTQIAGGRGAVRELCDLILLAQNKLDAARGLSV